MAQLTDDCFAFGGAMMTVDEAIALINERIAPVEETESVAIGAASGRILARDVFARVAVPSTDNSAVDGFAVRHADLKAGGNTRLSVSARIQAGSRAGPIAPGTAVRIFTGAPMPDGADTVFMQEDVEHDGDAVVLPAGLKLGANRRFAGEDYSPGTLVLPAGVRLDARHIAALAAVGHGDVVVRRRVRVALFSTGDELQEIGGELRQGATYDANRPLLAALLSDRGAEVQDLGILKDDAVDTAKALQRAAAGSDCVITSGGVSTGEADFVKAAVEGKGSLTFWRLAIKPGRPVAMGAIDGAAFLGLPGNPAASFVTFSILAGPLIDRFGGMIASAPAAFPAIADFHAKKKSGRREYMRGTMRADGGRLVVTKFPREGAALLSSLVETQGLIELREDVTRIAPGEPVGFIPYRLL